MCQLQLDVIASTETIRLGVCSFLDRKVELLELDAKYVVKLTGVYLSRNFRSVLLT